MSHRNDGGPVMVMSGFRAEDGLIHAVSQTDEAGHDLRCGRRAGLLLEMKMRGLGEVTCYKCRQSYGNPFAQRGKE